MRMGSRLFRVGLLLAGTSLSWSALAPFGPALAQPAPPPGQGDAANAGDPPALAGRLSDLTGTVSYHPAGADQWSPASQNFPVTSGNAYWTEPQASATIEIGDDVLTMDGGTELDVTTLDQTQFVASLPQGAIFLGLRDLPDGQSVTITTPRGAVQITQPGQYEIVAGDTNNPTSVTVVAGSAHVTATGVDLTVAAQQTGAITGADSFQGGVSAMQQDQFLQAQLAKFQPPQQSAPPAVAQQVRYMTGGQQLAQYGSWSQTQQYGQVWYPRGVASDWAPYRNGHWAYVQPWGWNWVDDEPWGFAPFHYGRWINDGGRWGWVAADPGVAYDGGYPTYAPALVSFVGVGGDVLAGAAIGFGVGLLAGGGGVGWFPLGYREPFVPWYHVSDGYFRNVNRYNVVNVRNITINNYRNIQVNHYANARFATVAPDRAFARGERMQGLARPLPAAALERAHPIVGRLPVAPNAQTPGLSRGAAHRYNVALPAHAGSAGQGPQIRPGGFGGRPALRSTGLPGNVRPANNALPPSARPGATPGARPGLGGGARPNEANRQPAGGTRTPGGAPGPAITRPGAAGPRPGGLPALRPTSPAEAPPGVAHPGIGNRPGMTRPGAETRPGPATPGAVRPDGARPEGARPGETRPGAAPGGLNRPGETRPAATPGEPRPGLNRPAPTRPENARPGAARPNDARPGNPGAPRPTAARQEAPRPAATRPEPRAPRPAPMHAAPRPEGRPAPRAEAPRPAPRAEAPRPAPRAEAPRPAPRAEAPRPAPHPAAPHPQARPGGPPEHKK